MASFSLEGARFSGRAGWLTLLGVILVPLVIGGLLIAGLWKPVDRLGQVTAAIVNLDEGTEIDGQTVPLGRLLAGGLVTGGTDDVPAGEVASVSGSNSAENFTWVLTDAEDAAAGLADGTYASAVTIPENFSEAATSYGDTDPSKAEKATIDIATSDRSRLVDDAVSGIVTSTAVSILNEQLTTTYLENVYVGFNDLGDGLATAADGASSLADGVSTLAGGTNDLADGIGELATGAHGLADGLQTFADETAKGAKQSAAGVEGAQQFADGLDALASGAEAIGGGAEASAGFAGDAAALSQSMAAQLGGLLQDCATTPTANCADIADLAASFGITQASPPDDSLLYLTGAASAAATGVSDGLNEGANGQPSFVDGLGAAAAGGGQLADGLAASADGLTTISDNLGDVATGAGELADGVDALGEGATQLADGAESASSGAGDLADGIADAADGLPSYTESEREHLAGVVAQPVTAEGAATDDLFGASSIPFFASLALWIGAFATFFLLAAVPHRSLGSTRSPVLLALGAAVPGALIGIVQGLALSIPLAILLDLPGDSALPFVLFTTLTAVAFSAVNQGIVALFGGVGRFVAMTIAVLALAVSVVSTVPPVFDAIIGVLPLSAAFSGGQSIIGGIAGTGPAIVAIVVWGLIGLGMTVVAASRRRVLGFRRIQQHLPELA